jgi:hypothetical protein
MLKYCNELSGTIDLQSTINQAEVLFVRLLNLFAPTVSEDKLTLERLRSSPSARSSKTSTDGKPCGTSRQNCPKACETASRPRT